MYTQCSKCETVFELSADVLRAAGGQVRCGNCGEVFNALARLAEDSSAFVTGETSIDLEARADSILESATVLPVAKAAGKDSDEDGRPGVEIARLEVFDWPEEDSPLPDADRSMEFTLPPGELDRIFVESKKPAVPGPPAASALHALSPEPGAQSAPKPIPKPVPQPVPKAAPQPTPKPVPKPASQPLPPAAKSQPAPSQPAPSQPAPSQPAGSPPAPLTSEGSPAVAPEPPAHPESAAADSAARNRVSSFEIPDDIRQDMLEGFEQRIIHPTALRNSAGINAMRRPFIMWLSAAVVSAMLLLAEIVHQNREWFVIHAHGPVGAVVRALYGAMGSPLPSRRTCRRINCSVGRYGRSRR